MRQRFRDSGSLPLVRLASAVLIAGATAACSSDSLRLAENPFSNPFAASTRPDVAATGAVQAAPAAKVRAAPLAAPTYQPLPANVGPTGQPPAVPRLSTAANAVTGSASGWSASGGTPITLGAGDTVEALSGRYGVPVAALRAANGLSGSAQPSPGQQFVIPAFNPSGKASAPVSAPIAQPARAAAPQPASTPRAPRYESLPQAQPRAAATTRPAAEDDDEPAPRKVAPVAKAPERKAVVAPPKTAVAAPARQTPPAQAKPASTKTAQTKPAVAAKVADDDDEDETPVKAAPAAKPAVVAKAEPKKAQPEPAKTVVKAPAKEEEPKTTGAVPAESAKATADFRWPARGRVISGFGSKGPGGTNDGINIALPEGTPVRAAESGTVVYAGEEIKGYGKMVLVRHPNGYVSAYANNSGLDVKRGDAVKRGQVIAKSGQTGNVTSPQLHFELRKGSEPVDPSKYLE
jgi:murein DD-endopeptidase MepM/ murein hydrolase activator NlpD